VTEDRVTQRENQSVRKAAALLRAAADIGTSATVSALAREAALPRATALRMIESLVAERLLARLPDDRIVLGPGLQRLARSTNVTELLVDAARAPMESLAEQVHESVTLTAMLPDGSLSLARQVDGPHLIGLTNWVGRVFDWHATSAGKLAMAYAEPARIEAMLAGPLRQVASRTVTDPQALRADLAATKRRGWSQIEDEVEDGLAAVSIGLFLDATLIGSLNISGPTTRFTLKARKAALPLLRQACRLVELNLGALPS
jgi:IclR family transcriptional regulator, acetate operon repressor